MNDRKRVCSYCFPQIVFDCFIPIAVMHGPHNPIDDVQFSIALVLSFLGAFYNLYLLHFHVLFVFRSYLEERYSTSALHLTALFPNVEMPG